MRRYGHTYLAAQGWDGPAQPRRQCFHLSTPRKDLHLSPSSILQLLSSVCSCPPPYYKDKKGFVLVFLLYVAPYLQLYRQCVSALCLRAFETSCLKKKGLNSCVAQLPLYRSFKRNSF